MSILLFILAALLLFIVGVVILSYAITWYEYANRRPAVLEERFSPGNLWLAFWLVATESLALLTTNLLRPLAWFPLREKTLEAASQTPVILLHGLFHSRACWVWIRFWLRRRGFHTVHSLKIPQWQDIESATERLSKKVDELRHATGVEKVHLLCHSNGGIIARNYVQIRGGARKVDRCILVATPNGGSKLAPFAVTRMGTALMPGSEFLLRLTAAELPPEVRITAIFSRHDNIVLPAENARLAGVRNIELERMGHTAILFHPRAVQAIKDALTEEEEA
jgi:triacylglycerol lipase